MIARAIRAVLELAGRVPAWARRLVARLLAGLVMRALRRLARTLRRDRERSEPGA